MSEGWVVRLPTWLGDTVMAVPTLRALERGAGGPLLLWGPPPYRELLASVGIRAPYLPYRRRAGIAGLGDVWEAAMEIRRREPDGALLLPNAFEPALIAALAGVPRRVGYATDGRGWLLTDAVPPPPILRPLHDADRYARLLEALEIPGPEPPDGALEAESGPREWGREILPGEGPWLGVVPGAANGPAKRWPPERYGRVADEAARRWGAVPVLLGSAADRAVCRAVDSACSAPCVDQAGTGLDDLVAALLRCRAVVSNDTGAAHLAAALGRPTVVLFGPTDPRKTGARGTAVRHVQVGCFCQPCGYQECPLDHRCMEDLDAEPVLEALEALW